MRLERLHLSGFKSFSDRSELAFDKGVTAIVGPNGCGKSNVADALTWVLGEQSAKSLRGDKMEDVIFSGSDARKPNMTAEVRLRLSAVPVPPRPGEEPQLKEFTARPEGHRPGHGNGHNGNGQGDGHDALDPLTHEAIQAFTRDVEITRRLYRSGESEYLIDGQSCRLRDIHELLMDTGLGQKAYAIIEQGKIGMILSSRPTDRRQLIEEAAGITKYKSRRRAAELKLEAAQLNLTRVDDIVFEVEKQRGTLKRQAAKARRYKRLRDELRRWEKVLFARRYRELAHAIEDARTRLEEARARETSAAAKLAEVENDLARLRIEQAEADHRAGGLREDAHARELEISTREQQIEFNRQQVVALGTRATEIQGELQELESRREPGRLALEERRLAAAAAEHARDEAAEALAAAAEAHARAHQRIEGLEGDVDAVRGEVFAAANSATALRHVIDHAAQQRARVAETLERLAVEAEDLRIDTEKNQADRMGTGDALRRAHEAMEATRIERAARESELASARIEHEWRARSVRTREQAIAGLEARLKSLEELEAARAGYSDAARTVLAQANGHVSQMGAVADYLEVEPRYERAVEACFGDLLQHVVVPRHEHAQAGLAIVREQDAGRCGFIVVDEGGDGVADLASAPDVPGVVGFDAVGRIAGPHAATIRQALGQAYFAESFEQALEAARRTTAPIGTLGGEVLHGRHVVVGGGKVEARGILAAKREIKELRDRVTADRAALATLADEATALELTITHCTSAIQALTADAHRQEKAIVGYEGQLSRANDDTTRLSRKGDLIATERRRADEEMAALEARQTEAQQAIERLQDEQRDADDRLAAAQRRLIEARGDVDELGRRAAEARATHAGLMERASALAADVTRLEEAARDLEQRVRARASELETTRGRREQLDQAIVEGAAALDERIHALEALREDLRVADEAATALRDRVEAQDGVIREARRLVEDIRSHATALEVASATAQSDLSHLAQMCVDTVQATLDEVIVEVEDLEARGEANPDAVVIPADEPEEPEDGADALAAVLGGEVAAAEGDVPPEVEAAAARPAEAPADRSREGGSMTAEEAITTLKGKIDRLGPVNMMAIEQYDELEKRHEFLTVQRKDLVDSIAQTAEAIKRIDETTKARFTEAFTAIQHNFQEMFSTLFGGGRAGLTLLDENDPLESGIDIVASPPGKRLQSVQLLSGGEKALTAISLMFAIFKYKPSPFCLLDEIDAPLDDANVGRFVQMLHGMLDRTQFIVITHNRKTMEIANRLYGVTMEEPGVSKLISIQLN